MIILNLKKLTKNKRGAILIFFGSGMIAIFAFLSLGVDLGIIYKERAEMQQVVDAAAIAGSKKITFQINDKIVNGQELEWTETDSFIVKNAVIESALKNNEILTVDDITLTPAGLPQQVNVKKSRNVSLFFAQIINVDSMNISVSASADNQFLGSLQYDILPWGIPDALATQVGEVELQEDDHFNGFSISGDAGFSFAPGKEYLLKLGSGIPDSFYEDELVGDKILIPMGENDQPGDAEFKKVYGFVYWCLNNGIEVQWMMNYRGGAFMLDYRGDLANGTFPDVSLQISGNTGTPTGQFEGVFFEIIDKTQLFQLYQQAHKIIDLRKALKVAVYTPYPVWTGNLLPFGIEDQELVDGENYIIKYNSEVNSNPVDLFYNFDETFEYQLNDTIREAQYGIDLDGNGSTEDYVTVKDITEVPITILQDQKITVDINADGDYLDIVNFEGLGDGCANDPMLLPGPGNFAALALGSTGASIYEGNITNGYDGTISVGDLILSETGNMSGPTYDGVSYRVEHGLIYVVIPILNTLDVNGRKIVEIVGFANFKLLASNLDNSSANAGAEVIAEYIDSSRLHNDSENPENYIITKILTEAGVPYTLVHDEDILNDELIQYDILMCDSHGPVIPEVAAKISAFTSQGGVTYTQCQSGPEIDTRINQYNTINTTSLETLHFSPVSLNVNGDFSILDTNNGSDFYLANNYDSMELPDLMAIQNSSTTINGFKGEFSSFSNLELMTDNVYLGAIDVESTKFISRKYSSGLVFSLAGHDQATVEGYRLTLNTIFAGTRINWRKPFMPNLGCLDLNNIENKMDNQEYYKNILIGYEGVTERNAYVYTIPGNLPGLTNSGVTQRYDRDPAATMNTTSGTIIPSGSPRGIIVPIVEPSPSASEEYSNDNQERTVIYDLKGRSRVKIISFGLFLLSDINQNPVIRSDLSTNPAEPEKNIYNGQVRGLFVRYIGNSDQNVQIVDNSL